MKAKNWLEDLTYITNTMMIKRHFSNIGIIIYK
jgi:hypothetical protein